jgi:hypothetical protein
VRLSEEIARSPDRDRLLIIGVEILINNLCETRGWSKELAVFRVKQAADTLLRPAPAPTPSPSGDAEIREAKAA